MKLRGTLLALTLSAASLGAALPGPLSVSTSARGYVLVAWDVVGGAANYRIDRSPDGTTFSNVTMVAASLTLTTQVWPDSANLGCTPSIWWYRVSTYDGSAYGSATTATPMVMPCAPSAFSLSVTAQGLWVQWTAAAGASAYELLSASAALSAKGYDSAVSQILTPSSGVFYAGPLDLSHSAFALISVDTAGNSSTALLMGSRPSAPVWMSLTATGQSGNLALAWGSSSETGVSLYRIFRRNDSSLPGPGDTLADLSVTATLLSGMADGVTQYFWMSSLAGLAGAGPVLGPLSATPYALPVTPTGLVTLATQFKPLLGLVWDALPSPLSDPISAVEIYKDNVRVQTVPGWATQTYLTVTCGVSSQIKIRALNSQGQAGPYSSVLNAGAICAPSLLSASLAGSDLSFSYSAQVAVAGLASPSSGLVAYALVSKAAEPMPFGLTHTSLATGVTILAQSNGESRWYHLYTVDSLGSTSSASLELAILPPPTATLLYAGRDRARLAWSTVNSSTLNLVTGYRVFYAAISPTTSDPGVGTADPGLGQAVTVTLSGLTAGQDYAVSIASRGGSGVGSEGSLSQAIWFKAQHPSPVPLSLSQSLGGGLTLTVSAVDAGSDTVLGYTLYRSDSPSLSPVVEAAGSSLAGSLYSTLTASAGTMSYWFAVLSDTASNTSSLVPSSGFVLAAPSLAAPSLSALASANRRALLNWTSVSNANLYQVYRATAASGPWQALLAGRVAGLDYIDLGAPNGQAAYYQVSALYISGLVQVEGVPSASQFLDPRVPPGAPGRYLGLGGVEAYALTLTASTPLLGRSDMSLSWSPALSGSLPLSAYRVYRGSNGSALSLWTTVYLTSTASLVDSQKTVGLTYTYAVEAIDQGTPNLAGPRSSLTALLALPSAPTGLTAGAAAGGSSASLTWTASAHSGVASRRYLVERAWQPPYDWALLAQVTRTSYVDAGANTALSVAAHYRVRAVSFMELTSSASQAVSLTLGASVPLAGLPTAPTQLSIEPLTGTARPALISWRPNPAQEAVQTYHVYRDGTWLSSSITPRWVDAVGVHGATYAYQVQAQNAFGGGLSASAAAYTHGPPSPSSLALDLSADVNGSTVTSVALTWSSLDVPSEQSAYRLYRATFAFSLASQAQLLTETSQVSWRDELGLSSGQYYQYRVLGLGDIEGLIFSAAVSVSPSAALAAPTVSVVSGQASGEWGAVVVSVTSPAGARQLWLLADTSPLLSQPQVSMRVASIALGDPDQSGRPLRLVLTTTAGVAIYVGAAVGDETAFSTVSSSGPFYSLAGPASLTASAGYVGQARVSLSWSAPSEAWAQASAYRVERDFSPAFSSPSQLSFTANYAWVDAPAPTNTALYYRVTSFKGSDGAKQNWGPIWVYDPPSLPSGVSASANSGRLDLVWSPALSSEGVTGYRVARFSASAPLGVTQTVGLQHAVSLSGLSANEWVTATVEALNSAGPSVGVMAATRVSGLVAQPVPAVFSAQVGFAEDSASISRVRLSWTPTGAPYEYYLYRSTSPLALTQAAGGLNAPLAISRRANTATLPQVLDDTQVTAGQTYYYALTAVSPTGLPAGESVPVYAAPVSPFNYPSFATITAAQGGDGRIDLAWAQPRQAGSAGFDATWPYRLYRYTQVGTAVPSFVAGTQDAGYPLVLSATTYTDLNVVNGAYYAYQVTVVDSLGREQSLGWRASGIQPSGPRQAPQAIQAIAGDGRVTLRWVSSVYDAQAGALYNVYRRLSSGSYAGSLPGLSEVGPLAGAYVGVTLLVQTLSDSTAVNKTSYCYALSVVGASGEGQRSIDYCATPYTPLKPPLDSNVVITVLNRKDVRLTWASAVSSTAGYDLNYYQIYRSSDGGASFIAVTQVAALQPTLAMDYATNFGATYVYRVVPVDTAGNEGDGYGLATVSIPPPINNIRIFRNGFNPDKGEACPVQFTVVKTGHVWVRVYTQSGEHVVDLFEEDVVNANDDNPYLSLKKDWDGKNSQGQTVASGVYTIHMEAPGFKSSARVAVIK